MQLSHKQFVLLSHTRFCFTAGIKRSHRELFLDTLICNVEPNAKLLLADIIPTGVSFQSSHHPHISGGSRHVGYVVHGQHEVKVAHKCDAFDSTSDAIPLTQESKGLLSCCLASDIDIRCCYNCKKHHLGEGILFCNLRLALWLVFPKISSLFHEPSADSDNKPAGGGLT